MFKEIDTWVKQWRILHLSNEELLKRITELKKEMKPFKDRLSSEGFIFNNESFVNQEYSLLVQTAEKRKLQIE